MTGIKVVGSALEEFCGLDVHEDFDLVTMRAVGKLPQLMPYALNCLKPGGRLCLWLGSEQAAVAMGGGLPVAWSEPLPIPLSQKRQIAVGTKLSIS